MTDSEKKTLRLDLEQRLEALRCDSAELGIENCADENEYASRVADRNMLLLLQERKSSEIKEIETALERLDTTDYGLCEECGEEISLPRLFAKPSAILCIECQELKEAEIAA